MDTVTEKRLENRRKFTDYIKALVVDDHTSDATQLIQRHTVTMEIVHLPLATLLNTLSVVAAELVDDFTNKKDIWAPNKAEIYSTIFLNAKEAIEKQPDQDSARELATWEYILGRYAKENLPDENAHREQSCTQCGNMAKCVALEYLGGIRQDTTGIFTTAIEKVTSTTVANISKVRAELSVISENELLHRYLIGIFSTLVSTSSGLKSAIVKQALSDILAAPEIDLEAIHGSIENILRI